MMSLPTAPAKGYYAGIVGLQAFLDGKAKTITGYKATGKYTLEVDLEKPIATFLNIMEMPFSAPVAKEWVAKWGKQVGRHPLGTGPYVRRPLDAQPGPPAQAQHELHGHGGLPRRHPFRLLDHADHRRPQGAERRRRPARRLHPAGQLPQPDRQPPVEEPGGGRAGRRARLPLLQRDGQAVRQPGRAPGALVGHRPRQDRQAALGHRPAAQPDLPRRAARPRRRSRR